MIIDGISAGRPTLPYDAVLSQPMPVLATARLNGTEFIDLPVDLFGLHAPRLQLLSLINLAYDWSLLGNPSVTSCLRHLHLSNESNSVLPKIPTWTVLLDTLSGMRFLETLKLGRDVMPSNVLDDPISRTSRVMLDRVTCLELHGTVCSVAELLHWLSVPAGLKLDLSLHEESALNPRGLSPIISLLSSYRGGDGAGPPVALRRLSITEVNIGYYVERYQAKLSLYATEKEDGSSPLVTLRVSISRQEKPSEASQVLHTLVEALPLSDIKALDIDEFPITMHSFVRLFGTARQVTSMQVHKLRGSAMAIVRALTPPTNRGTKRKRNGGDATATAHWALHFPMVQELKLDKVDFQSRKKHGVFALLKTCLRRRRGLNINITESTDLGYNGVRALKKIAGSGAVKWKQYFPWDELEASEGSVDSEGSMDSEGSVDSDDISHSYDYYSDDQDY